MRLSDTRRVVVLLMACVGVAALAPVGASSSTLLVLNKGNLTMVTVDPATLKVTGSYPSGPDPHEVIASSDGKTAYISLEAHVGAAHTKQFRANFQKISGACTTSVCTLL